MEDYEVHEEAAHAEPADLENQVPAEPSETSDVVGNSHNSNASLGVIVGNSHNSNASLGVVGNSNASLGEKSRETEEDVPFEMLKYDKSGHSNTSPSQGKSMPASDYADVENSVEIKTPKRKWKLGFSDLGMDLVRACFAEALGTFFLILICVGCANSRVLDSLSTANATVHLQPTYYLAIAFGFGIGIGGIVHILSEASGGHVNPAVSFALFLDKRISFVCLIFYVISQFLGGFAGAGVLYGMGNHSDLDDIYGGNAYDSIEWYQAFLFEMFGTMFLVLTILATINEKRGYVQSYLQPFAIGLAIFIMHIWLIPYTNCGINPVRGTVWNIVIGVAGDQSLVFLFAPLVGAGFAVPIFNYIFNPGYCS